jgi:5-methylcytosine-specific restriction protein B
MKEPTEQEYALWDQFLELFPPEKLKTMSLEEYSQIGTDDTFTWWVERKLDSIGRITGTNAFKFGIYATKNPKEYQKQYKGDGQYAWFSKFGETSEEAFHTVRSFIVKIAQAASIGDLDAIETIDLYPIYKWKVAFLYQDRTTPTILNVFKKEMIAKYFQQKGIELSSISDFPAYYREVMKHRAGIDVLEYGKTVWSVEPQIKKNESVSTISTHKQSDDMLPLNQILYGPPGTGKTYNTATRAVEICDGSYPEERAALMERYRALIADNRISFVSFHQSFSYEEFIEGIRPELTAQGDSEHEQLIYKVEDGIFKRICSMAKTAVDDLQRPKTAAVDLTGKNFYKMSVGGKYDPEVELFCFDNDYISLGWGGDVDFSQLPKEKEWEPARDSIKQLMVDSDSEQAGKRFAVQAMYWFKNHIDVGDIVIVSKGLTQVQAIAQVTGEYEYRPELIPGEGYEHFRKVRWLIKDAAIPVEKVWAKQFSQQTIYSLRPPTYLNLEYLERLLGGVGGQEQSSDPERYVLIVDEINRANISKVLGELITLVEPDKRLGALNEVTVKLPYSREEFGVPANLHIIGTMNTADRSLALMDTALRRRFEFKEIMPRYDLLSSIEVDGVNISKLLKTMNQRITALYDREHTIGHAFLMPLKQDASIDHLASIFEHKIIPLLAEYFFEDWQKIRLVLGDNQKTKRVDAQFILEDELEDNGSALFGNSTDLAMYGLDRGYQYVRNDDALTEPDAYIGIYSSILPKEE